MKIWIVTDGKIGDRVQCAGVAAALGGDVDDKVVRPSRLFALLAPFGPADPRDRLGEGGGAFAPPFPDILIASGRRAIPYARAVKRKSGGRTKVVLLKDPRIAARFADLIWTPRHDRRTGENVFSTLTSPHGLAEAIAKAAGIAQGRVGELQKPILGVVLGGPSGGAKYNQAAAVNLADAINHAARGYASVAVTPSRRTPRPFIDALSASLAGGRTYIWNGEGDNPYTDILGNAETLIVAADSHNMMSEAVATKAGVYAWRPKGLAGKMEWFVDELERTGRVRRFDGDAAAFTAPPIDATGEIVAEIRKRLGGG